MAHNLVLLHACLGGLALGSGLLALIVKKGGRVHVQAGRVFFWSMLCSALLGALVACLPGHINPFLFSIGVFSAYLVASGFRALRFKSKYVRLTFDFALSVTMGLTGIGMLLGPVVFGAGINIVLAVFGTIGLVFAITDIRNFRNKTTLRKKWLVMHLTKMTAGYIAATTAFVVVNQFFYSGLIGWLAPSVIGTAFIIYWTRKVSPRPVKNAN